MSKAYTINDFIFESEVFEFSKEYFDLISECGSITLMEFTLNANNYLSENKLMESQTNMISSLFTESGMTISSNELLTEETEAKVKKSIWSKAKSVLMKVLGKIKNGISSISTFFGKLVANNKKKAAQKKELKLYANNKTETEKIVDAADKFLSYAAKNENDHDGMKKLFGDGKQFIDALEKVDGIGVDHVNNAKRKLYNSSYNPEIKIPAILVDLEKFNKNILSIIHEIKSLIFGNADKLSKSGNKIAKSIAKLTEEIENAYETKSKTIKVDDMNKIQIELENSKSEIIKNIDSIKTNINDNMKELPDQFSTELGKMLTALTELSVKYNKAISDAIRSVNGAIKERDQNYKDIAQFVMIANDKGSPEMIPG